MTKYSFTNSSACDTTAYTTKNNYIFDASWHQDRAKMLSIHILISRVLFLIEDQTLDRGPDARLGAYSILLQVNPNSSNVAKIQLLHVCVLRYYHADPSLVSAYIHPGTLP